MTEKFKHPISVAPMMKRTDRHFRYLMRQITRHTLLYTEMVPAGAIVHRPEARERFLGFDQVEHPISLQVGGSDPAVLAECARIAEDFGYDEINLNVGCPSDRVKTGHFGACLMAEPDTVARAIEAMMGATKIEVTVKHRIGIDDIDSYDDMLRFVDTVAATGCRRFSVHARKAWLQGLSPEQNRNVPPLRHEEVYRLKEERPNLIIETNGGIKTLDETARHLEHVDAVMIGRAAYDDPYLFADVDRRFYGDDSPVPSRHEIVERLFDYAEYCMKERGCRLGHLSRHFLQIFAGQPGARRWRRHLSDNAHRDDAGVHTLRDALALIPDLSTQSQGPASSAQALSQPPTDSTYSKNAS